LVAEETADRRALLGNLLTNAGYETLDADNGVTALRLLHEGRADVALLDLRLPGMNGLEVLKQVRQFAPHLPVLMIANPGSTRSAVEALQRGADDYLTLPLHGAELIQAVEEARRRRGSHPPQGPGIQERPRQVARLEALGRLTSGVAHDLNNLMTFLIGSCELVLERLGPASPVYPDLVEVQKAGGRAADLSRRLLQFVRPQEGAPRVFDLNTLLADMQGLLRRVLREDIELTLVLDAKPALVFVDPVQMEQLVLNLALNARDAILRAGRLTLTTESNVLSREKAPDNPHSALGTLHASLPPGPYVFLTVIDTGCGMEGDVLAHIFDPFFTTKELSRSTGLGLAGVREWIQRSGGDITVASTPGQGSTFAISLPLARQAAEPANVSAAAAATGGVETVLILEDDPWVGQLLGTSLREQGYTVLEARRGEDALRACEQHCGPLHLLIADVVLPGMSGNEVFACLAPRYPGLKVLYISGHFSADLEVRGVLRSESAFLQKPFAVAELMRMVRSVLEGNWERRENQQYQAERRTLLLVESDGDTRDAMTMMLFTEGYQVVAVPTGRDAWKVLRYPFTPIDGMLLDVHLPDVSGIQLVRRLRETYPTLPVFAWMYRAEPAEAAQLGQFGVHQHTCDPSAETAELVEAVRSFLRGASPPE
jgi:DNA-binding response OmpR family regulator